MRTLTVAKPKRVIEGLLNFVTSTWSISEQWTKGGVFGLRVTTLFLLLGSMPAVLNVNSLNADEIEKGESAGGLNGVVVEGVSQETRGDLRLGARAILGVETNAYVWGSRDHVATSTASAEPSLRFDSYTLTGRLAASKGIKETDEYKWEEDFQVGLSRKAWKLSRRFDLTPAISGILPITQYSRKYSLLEYGVGGKMSLAWDLDHSVRGLKLTSSVKGTHYEYEIPVAFDGTSNESWRLNTRLIADWEFVKTLSLSLLFGRTWAWTVNGNNLDRFEMDQSITWAPFEVASLAIGHSRGGNVLRSDGNSNLSLYDSRDSSFYMSLELNF